MRWSLDGVVNDERIDACDVDSDDHALHGIFAESLQRGFSTLSSYRNLWLALVRRWRVCGVLDVVTYVPNKKDRRQKKQQIVEDQA